ncbi:MAG: DUF2911 domain-containing protein [bacterium]|nr:DUF2911 domain-containing protein [bacterium]
MKRRSLFTAVLGLAMGALTMGAQAQDIKPQASPYAEVLQRIGTTDVKITYHRPGVKGRQIWGELVPYHSEKPWRAGANDATTFSINKDVKIEGKPLPAGNYTFYIDVGEDEWTLIFSKVEKTWGSFNYDAKDDALRVKVKPQEAPMKEWLVYGFGDLTMKSASAYIHWEKLKASFKIETE